MAIDHPEEGTRTADQKADAAVSGLGALLSEGSLGSRAVLGLLGLVAIALVYPLISLGAWMMGRDYYQHFPLMIIAAIVLGWLSLRDRPASIRPQLSLRVLMWSLLAVGSTALVFAIPSRWMASLAAIFWLIAAFNFVGGRSLTHQLQGPLMLLCAAMPLPVNLDNAFVVWLQQLATRLSSLWLDLIGVLHLATGVAINTGTQEYIVEEACSGIHSIFAAIAVGVGYAVLRGYSITRLLITVAQLLLWVVVANAIRVFSMVYFKERWGFDLTDPTYHELLGFLTFALGLLLALSGDHMLRYIRPLPATNEETTLPLRRAWIPALDSPVSDKLAAGIAGGLGVLGLLVGLAFYSFESQPIFTVSIEEMAKQTIVDLGVPDEGILPDKLGDWKKTGFASKKREAGDIFGGMASLIWEYQKGNRRVALSLDGPYDSWHDLSICYTGVGWRVADRKTFKIGRGEAPWIGCDLRMSQDPIGKSQVLFVCVDPSGKGVDPPSYFGNALEGFLMRARTAMEDRSGSTVGVVQLQLLDQRLVMIPEVDAEANRELLSAATEHLFQNRTPRGSVATK
jgi:exosortase